MLQEAAIAIKNTPANPVEAANVLESSGHLDSLYASIAAGSSVEELSMMTGIDAFFLDQILKSSAKLRKKYLSSRAMALAEGSVNTMALAANLAEFEAPTAAAMAHHRKVLEVAIRSNSEDDKDGNATIIVNNNFQAHRPSSAPPVPAEIRALIDAD